MRAAAIILATCLISLLVWTQWPRDGARDLDGTEPAESMQLPSAQAPGRPVAPEPSRADAAARTGSAAEREQREAEAARIVAQAGAALGTAVSPSPLARLRPGEWPEVVDAPRPGDPAEYHEAWEELVAPLVDPEDPTGCQPLPGVSASEVLDAKQTYLNTVRAPNPGDDAPILQLDRRLNLFQASELAGDLSWADYEDRLQIYEILRDAQEDPDVPVQTYTFAAPRDHPEATTRGKLNSGQWRQREQQRCAGAN
jgi:hypothetical protein